MAEHFRFSSAREDPADAFALYSELLGDSADLLRGDGEFRAELHASRVDGLIRCDRRLSGVIHQRQGVRLADGQDGIALHALLEGGATVRTRERTVRAQAGDVLILDMRRPAQIGFDDAHLISIGLERERAVSLLADVDSLHGQVIRPPTSTSLLGCIQSGNAEDGQSAAAILRCLAEALGQDGREDLRQRRKAVERYIERKLSDRALSVDSVAEAIASSRSALYRLYDGEGGLRRLIQVKRITAARQRLELGYAGTLAQLSELCGFASESHMSRLFSQTYGLSPNGFRNARKQPRQPRSSTFVHEII